MPGVGETLVETLLHVTELFGPRRGPMGGERLPRDKHSAVCRGTNKQVAQVSCLEQAPLTLCV